MNFARLSFLTLFIFLLLFTKAYSHVGLDLPQGGEIFESGSTITIQWHIIIDHGPCNWDLYFSGNGGSTWEAVVSDLPKSQLSYDWTVPQTATQQGVIRVVQDNQNGIQYDDYSGVFTIEIPTVISETEAQLSSYKLFPAYPNPFNPQTKLRYSLPHSENVSLIIYDLLGNEIKTLAKGEKPAGTYEVKFDGSDLPSGIYIYRLEAGDYTAVRKLVLLK